MDGRRTRAAAKVPQWKRPCRSRATARRSSFLSRSIRGIVMNTAMARRLASATYRQLAEKSENVPGKQELLDLAVVCEEGANFIEDRLTGGEAPRCFFGKTNCGKGAPEGLCPPGPLHKTLLLG